jgi:hypothetical protein
LKYASFLLVDVIPVVNWLIMQFSIFSVVLSVGVALVEAQEQCEAIRSTTCVLDDCLKILKVPAVKTLASSFCSTWNQAKVTKTVVATKTVSQLSAKTQTATVIQTITTTLVDTVTSHSPVPTVTM